MKKATGSEDGYTSVYSTLNRKVNAILHALHINTPFDEDTLPPHVRDLVNRGLKIQAIKEYREHFGVGLKEAKDAVDGNASGPPSWGVLNQKLDRILAELGVEGAVRVVGLALPAPGGAQGAEAPVLEHLLHAADGVAALV